MESPEPKDLMGRDPLAGRRARAPRHDEGRCAAPGNVVPMSEFNNESVSAIETTLEDVDHVLERLRRGTYRHCEVCQTPLDDAQLLASPLAAKCRAHLDIS